jgi:hypothetical protein
VQALHDGVDRKNDEEVDGGRDEQELDRGVEEVAVLDVTTMDVQHQVGEIRLLDDGCDQWRDDVAYQRVDDTGESRADDNGNGQIDYITAQDEVAKTFEHRLCSSAHSCTSPESHGR